MPANPIVVVDTSLGTIRIELAADRTPATVANFLQYVDDKHYDGLIFHRVIGNFMIQGGGFDSTMKQKKTRSPIRNEAAAGPSNRRGTIAMARTNDPHSATSQFFINVVDNGFLDQSQARDGAGYCAFGQVIDGMDVVDKIKAVKTGTKSGFSDVPLQDVTIKTIRMEEKEG
jgi:peptidyl-prolyl cis-trans isomerase B (cyclophilin B)